jgi:hypothetical protein
MQNAIDISSSWFFFFLLLLIVKLDGMRKMELEKLMNESLLLLMLQLY